MSTETIDLQGEKYTVNKEFVQSAHSVADELDLDELHACEILLQAQDESESSGQSLETCSVIRFHQRRRIMLECLRLILFLLDDVDQNEVVRDWLREYLTSDVIEFKGVPKNPKSFSSRCLSSMADIEVWIQVLADFLTTTNQQKEQLGPKEQVVEVREFQRVSLMRQHELLGVINLYLVKQNYSNEAEFELLLRKLQSVDKYDNTLCKFLPLLPLSSLYTLDQYSNQNRFVPSPLFPRAISLYLTLRWPRKRFLTRRCKIFK
jgi:nuclear pore complex protein Nup205